MELIVITVVIIISLSIIILLLLLAPLFLERIIKKRLNYNFYYFNFLIMLLLSNSSYEIIIDHQNRWVTSITVEQFLYSINTHLHAQSSITLCKCVDGGLHQFSSHTNKQSIDTS